MSKIIKKVMLKNGENDWAGNISGEMLIDENGDEVYISISDIGMTALYYVTNESIINNLINLEPVDEFVEKYEFGELDEYKGEKAMASSKYYGCFKYLYGLLYKTDAQLKEYDEDYEKDLDGFDNLDSIKFQNC